jgi:hypothetical protein
VTHKKNRDLPNPQAGYPTEMTGFTRSFRPSTYS